ncbi:MAG: exonuclease SbcCD subunit D [Muribaculaceae bacterium]|nr:exonuclease SbcCD subunit D [Muribaculaceae bacterium]
MKIIHTADLHLGQTIYQHYDRSDEHDRFFSQLDRWCGEERPDALIVAGDIFDIQQPGASVWKHFNDTFVGIRRRHPSMAIVIIAGNHDSPSRMHSHRSLWHELGATIMALPPASDVLERGCEGWEDEFILELPSGFIVAIPYMYVQRGDVLQHLLDEVARRNTEAKPVVMTGHLTVAACDITGHDFDIGNLRAVDPAQLGTGYDYLALGHIHRPQTIGAAPDGDPGEVRHLPGPVVRYAGSVLHVSCDEAYPHTVSVVRIDRHGGEVSIRTRRIEQLRHFHVLSFTDEDSTVTAEEALKLLERKAKEGETGYFRFRLDRSTALPPDFTQRVYAIISAYGDKLRYNPKIDWTGSDPKSEAEESRPRFEVAELQQMTDPMQFIEKTIDQYSGLSLTDLRAAFRDIEGEMRRMAEEEKATSKMKKS